MSGNPQGLRQNNPGNIRFNAKNIWKGLADPPSINGFCNFIKPEYGVRAMMILILNWYRKKNIKTIRQVIDRWAPPCENPTENYVRWVAMQTSLDADDELELDNLVFLIPIIKAMILFENGPKAVKYEEAVYGEAARMAGLYERKNNV